MDEERPPGNKRETYVTVLLALLLGGALLFILYFLTFGFISYVIAAVLGMVLMGYIHYALWGFALSEETAAEREQELIRQRMEAEEIEDRRRDLG